MDAVRSSAFLDLLGDASRCPRLSAAPVVGQFIRVFSFAFVSLRDSKVRKILKERFQEYSKGKQEPIYAVTAARSR